MRSFVVVQSHKINPSCGLSYIDSREWIKNKNNENDKSFQHATTSALNYEEVKNYPQRISKIKSYISKYNCESINWPSEKDDWKKIWKINDWKII